MPEGDSLRRVAERLRALEGEVVSAEAPHPRAAALGIADRLDGRRLELAELSPWDRLGALSDDALERLLAAAAELMHAPGRGGFVYRRAGLPCRRCGTPIRSRAQGPDARIAYWCPSCQAGTEPGSA